MQLSLNEGVGELHTALDLGAEYLDDDVVHHARATLERSVERRGVGEDVTVVALAGATGSGKSSLLNALVGTTVARVAATRPTTSEPLAVTGNGAHKTLEWLGINQRYAMPDLAKKFGSESDAEIVLVDLPDIDSTFEHHRETAARLTQLVDVVVWVLDPQKYADAVVHEDYFSRLGEHADVTLVVLNQADRLDQGELDGVLADIDRILERDGLNVEVYPTSAATGLGIPELRARIVETASARHAAHEKLAADIRSSGRELAGNARLAGGTDPSHAKEPEFAPVSKMLARAGGAHIVAKAAGESYTHRARKATGWPATRWIRQARIDPLKRLHLDKTIEPAQIAPATGLTVSESHVTQARSALRNYVEEATGHMPRAWARDVRDRADERTSKVHKDIDTLIARTNLEAKRSPLWWSVVNLLQWLVLLTAIVGGVWLLLLIFADTLQLQLPDPPAWGIFPLPTLLLLGGIVAGWLLSLVSRYLVSRGAKRTEERVQRRLDEKIVEHAENEILVPLREEVGEYAQFVDITRRLTQVKA